MRTPFLLSILPGILLLAGCGQDGASGASQTSSSGASLTASSSTVTSSTARIVFSEKYTDGTLCFYYSPKSFSAADTTRADVTRLTVSQRGSGTVTLKGLSAGTTYYWYFQGFYAGKSPAGYSAWGLLTTTAAAARTSDAGSP